MLDPAIAVAKRAAMLDTLLRPAVFRILFWLVLLGAATMAFLPKPPFTPIDQFGDKFAHILAFATLAVLANLGFPEAAKRQIVERLSFFGAAIEVVQSIPALHRDCDVRDWMADTLAVAVITAGFVAWRAWRGRRA